MTDEPSYKHRIAAACIEAMMDNVEDEIIDPEMIVDVLHTLMSSLVAGTDLGLPGYARIDLAERIRVSFLEKVDYFRQRYDADGAPFEPTGEDRRRFVAQPILQTKDQNT